jgi:hypothetical protein
MVPWFVPCHIHFYYQTVAEHDVLPLNQLKFSNKMSVEALYSTAENQPVYTNKSCVAHRIRVDGKCSVTGSVITHALLVTVTRVAVNKPQPYLPVNVAQSWNNP